MIQSLMIGIREGLQTDRLEQFLVLTEDDWMSLQWRMPVLHPALHGGAHHEVAGAGHGLLN